MLIPRYSKIRSTTSGVKDDFEGTAYGQSLNEASRIQKPLGTLFMNPITHSTSTIADVEHVLIFPNSSRTRSGGELVQLIKSI